MKILIFGKGYVAGHFLDFYGSEKVEISDLRVENLKDVQAELSLKKPDIVINAIGKTGRPNVDWCEDNKMETLNSNVTAPLILARACEEANIYMVHIGSGCVYEGDNNGQGFSEYDEPNFAGSFYSKTKAWSEAILAEFPILQLRLRMPLDENPGPRNFITKITKYSKIINVPNSISIMEDFLNASDFLMNKKAVGIYNMTNPGSMDHKAILEIYKELVDPNFTYEIIELKELANLTKAGRSNCELSSKKLELEGFKMRPIEEALRATLSEYAINLQSLNKA